MAASLRLFSSFSSAKAASLMPKSSPTLLLYCSPANLRMVRTVTSATVSSNEAPEKRAPRGIMKPRPVSPEMQDLVGVPEISRTQALKQIWAHIKEHNLQVFFPFHFLSLCKMCLVGFLNGFGVLLLCLDKPLLVYIKCGLCCWV